MRNIYQIGFNKSGTTTLHNLFKNNGIKSVHWDSGRLPNTIQKNHKDGLPLFTGYEQYNAFTDMGSIHFRAEQILFKEMYYQDPKGLFILNTRPVEDFINSRINHDAMLFKSCVFHNLSPQDVIRMWVRDYFNHCKDVREFFIDKQDAFFDYRIMEYAGDEVCARLNEHGINIDPSTWVIRGASRKSRHNFVSRDIDNYIKEYYEQ